MDSKMEEQSMNGSMTNLVMDKCMAFTRAYVLSKRFWQQKAFSVSAGLETALFSLLCVHIRLGLVLSSVFFFHFL